MAEGAGLHRFEDGPLYAPADLNGQSNRRPVAISFHGGRRRLLTNRAKRHQFGVRPEPIMHIPFKVCSFQHRHEKEASRVPSLKAHPECHTALPHLSSVRGPPLRKNAPLRSRYVSAMNLRRSNILKNRRFFRLPRHPFVQARWHGTCGITNQDRAVSYNEEDDGSTD